MIPPGKNVAVCACACTGNNSDACLCTGERKAFRKACTEDFGKNVAACACVCACTGNGACTEDFGRNVAACACVCTGNGSDACACTEDLSKHTRKILAKCLNAALQFMQDRSGYLDTVVPGSEDKDYFSKVLPLRGLTLLRDVHHRKSYQDVNSDHTSHIITIIRVNKVMNFFRRIDTLVEDFYRYEPVNVGAEKRYAEDKCAISMIGLAAATVTKSHCPENRDIRHFMGGLMQDIGVTNIWSELLL